MEAPGKYHLLILDDWRSFYGNNTSFLIDTTCNATYGMQPEPSVTRYIKQPNQSRVTVTVAPVHTRTVLVLQDDVLLMLLVVLVPEI